MPAPTQVKVTSLADYLAAMSRAVFIAGMSWSVVDAKWPGIFEAFDHFDPETVAAYSPVDVDRLMANTDVIRNRKKIEATVHNAGEMIVVDREFHGFAQYLDSFPDTADLLKDLHRRFMFLGESVARIFLYTVGFRSAEHEAWSDSLTEKKHAEAHARGGRR